MTYNFDPERWFEIQRSALQRQREAGNITEEEYQRRLSELMDKYEQMLKRLDIRHDY